MKIKIKRIYDPPEDADGLRILIDRIWPRGVSKESARLDEWLKEIAPSDELRKWFDHKEENFEEFSKKYKEELKNNHQTVEHLLQLIQNKTTTLLYGAKDQKHNQAVVLQEFLEGQQKEPPENCFIY